MAKKNNYVNELEAIQVVKAVATTIKMLDDLPNNDAAIQTAGVNLLKELTDFNTGERIYLSGKYSPDAITFYPMYNRDIKGKLSSITALYCALIEQYERDGINKRKAKKLGKDFARFEAEQNPQLSELLKDL